MTYKYKETLKSEVHFLGSQFSEQMRNELDEVYRKAKSFDKLRVIIEMSMQKDSMYHYYDDHGAFGVDHDVLFEDLQSIIKEGLSGKNY